MKKRVWALLVLPLMLVLSSCGKEASYAESTVYGKVTKIEDNQITLILGSMEADQMTNMQPMGEIPRDFSGIPENMGGEAITPNEILQDNFQSENNGPAGVPAIPDGQGEMEDGRMPMLRPDGQGEDGNFGNNRTKTTFKEGNVVLKVDLSKASLTKNGVTLENSELSEGQIISVVFDGEGKAVSATVLDFFQEQPPKSENLDHGGSSVISPSEEWSTVEEGTLLQITGGEQAAFVLDGQTVSGNIKVDASSTLDFTLKNGSVYSGMLTVEKDGAGSGSNSLMVVIGSNCTWNLTGNSTVSSLTNEGSIVYNGYTITLNSGKILSGE